MGVECGRDRDRHGMRRGLRRGKVSGLGWERGSVRWGSVGRRWNRNNEGDGWLENEASVEERVNMTERRADGQRIEEAQCDRYKEIRNNIVYDLMIYHNMIMYIWVKYREITPKKFSHVYRI